MRVVHDSLMQVDGTQHGRESGGVKNLFLFTGKLHGRLSKVAGERAEYIIAVQCKYCKWEI